MQSRRFCFNSRFKTLTEILFFAIDTLGIGSYNL
jgi:hypothetical protein